MNALWMPPLTLWMPLSAFFPLIVAFGAAGTPPTNYDSGDRRGSITVTDNGIVGAGTDNNIVDGNETANSTNSIGFKTLYCKGSVTWDWGVGAKKIIDGINFRCSATNTHGASWEIWASSNMKDWILLKSAFTLGGAIGDNIYTWTNTKGYRAYMLINRAVPDVDASSSTPWFEEVYFKIATAGSQATVDTTVASYLLKGGVGSRGSDITVTTTATAGGGTIAKMFDGLAFPVAGSEGTTQSWFWSGGQTLREIKMDFGGSYSPKITEAKWFQSNTVNHGTWKWAGSNDDSSYTDLLTGHTLGGARVDTMAVGSTVAYRYYKMIQTAGTTDSGPWLQELELKLST